MSLQCLSMPRFYRVLVGIQSPAGVTTTRGVLRRFNDFLKLFSDIKKTFPKKSLPSAPPKGLLRMKSRALLEERRCSLEEWILKLLSDIDISRCMPVASFLELEAAARSSFQESQQPSEANPSTTSSISSDQNHSSLSLAALAGSSSIASDYGSDTAYETSELGSPSFGRDDVSELGLEELTLDEDLTNPMEKITKYSMSNIDEGLLMGESILDQLESFKKHKVQSRLIADNGSASKSVGLALDRAGSSFEAEPIKAVNHVRKPSNESIGSDLSSYRGGEMSNSWTPNLFGDASLDLPSGAEASRTMGSPSNSELQYSVGDIVLPRDQQPKLDRILMIMQRRLVTAKTDMEDLITRLNQEVAVKEYLTTKVKDLEVELETTKEKSRENLQQALSLEKERVTKMQWDMEELRQKSLEFELQLKSQKDAKLPADSTRSDAFPEKDELLRELEATKDQLSILSKQHEELEVKSKSDIKLLVKEVKSLRRSQVDLKQKYDESVQEKIEVEQLLQQELERSKLDLAARRKLLHDSQTLQTRLLECNIKIADDNFAVDSSSVSDVLDLLADSDKQIDLLLAESQLLAPATDMLSNSEDLKALDHELRAVLRDIFFDNTKLRKQMNFFICTALQSDSSTNENGNQGLTRETVLKLLFET
ncbi:PX domain-containing protein EREL1-like isoform X2 [Chenopodium quinoa]|uniref:PX domain-containing protein EREL1-like isoform X2 n=1 Tax=Chenopodium quinoa TaxID=63459 RepID=UPI000B781BE8|nr:PX domain-containing protein EREL1-like isoform X2 [Chenopodium quinoa]